MCKGNICTCPLPPVLAEINKVEFLAHDEAGTRLLFYDKGDSRKWVIVNDRGLFLEYDFLHRAWGDLYSITGIDAGEWTISTIRA